jgi:HlyD family secretion protein
VSHVPVAVIVPRAGRLSYSPLALVWSRLGITSRFEVGELTMTWRLSLLVIPTLVLFALGFAWPVATKPPVLVLGGVVEIQEVGLGPRVSGRVVRVNVREGDLVAPGEVLVVLDVPELVSQSRQGEARVRAARADLGRARNGPTPSEKEAARAEAAAARARWRRLEAGSREEEVREAKGAYARARADVQSSESEFARTDRLFRQGMAPRAELETARANLDRALGASASSQAHLDLVVHGNHPEQVAEALAVMEQAEAKYRHLLDGARPEEVAALEARLAEEEGKLEEVAAQLAEREVRAYDRGIVEVVSVRGGDLVPADRPIVHVLRAEDLWVKVFVPETELGQVRLHQAVRVKVDSYPGRRFDGTVAQIASVSEFTPRNVQTPDERSHQVFGLKVRVPDPQGIFKAGMAAEVELPLREEP